MADRFYPLGLPQDPDCWKTSLEVQNELRSYERSPFPPGTSIHMPGAREKFGYSNPGPVSSRLAQSHLTLREEVGSPHPRAHLAVPRVQEPDERLTFQQHDLPELLRSECSPLSGSKASSPMSPMRTAVRARSLPSLLGQSPTLRKQDPEPLITSLEDEHFAYFVPKGLQRAGRDQLQASLLSRLQKAYPRVTMPVSGEGTGFRGQNSHCDWCPKGAYQREMPTASQEVFKKPPFHRMSPLSHAGHLAGMHGER